MAKNVKPHYQKKNPQAADRWKEQKKLRNNSQTVVHHPDGRVERKTHHETQNV